jgi:xanthine dehydrogenase accessory factor
MDPLILEQVSGLLKKGHDLVVVSVVKRSGSIPSPTRKALAVFEGGSVGTVGGGILEANALNEARGLLGSGDSRLLPVRLTNEQASTEGMLCGGKATFLLESITATTAATWVEAHRRVELGEAGLFLVKITETVDSVTVDRRWVAADQVTDLQELGIDPSLVQANDSPSTIRSPDGLTFLDPVSPPDDLLVFGAGHLAQALVPVAHSLGYRCWVVDDRPTFAREELFPDAYRIVVDQPAAAVSHLPSGSKAWAVIVTRGHKDDATVLKNLLENTYRYVGMVGSTRKKRIIFDGLIAEGIDEAILGEVHCPIGLPIGGSSPSEIAVSIAAELVAVRYTKEHVGRP